MSGATPWRPPPIDPSAPPGSWRPTRKVTAAMLTVALWQLVVAICARAGVDLGSGVESAAGGVLTLLAAYWTPDGP